MIKRFWSQAGKVVGWLLTVSGGMVSIGIVLGLILGQPPSWALAILLPLLIFFGLAPIGIGSLFLVASGRIKQEAIRDRFFKLLAMQRGRVSIVEFAAAAQLEPRVAQQYLDGWARECSATFDVTEGGDMYYVFSVEPSRLSGGQSPFEVWQARIKALRN